MKLSALKKELHIRSRFRSIGTLAVATGQTKPTAKAFIESTKEISKKEDAMFEAITPDLTVDDFFEVIDRIREEKMNKIEREQFL